ncbi:hypothetical protein EIB75_12935 [Epilithonimonas vandammei]|uniref:Mobilization protein n=1 Tax=Epilithonimonas vandammei TaxID=2487072 RepID=A0A3G8ZHJ0_9FLAO|nr:hypothetical protein [Epilithonimonas vandammei]AZI56107.1 hypothetical protein EIB75_12935 [Epilithonimonas vandammei]
MKIKYFEYIAIYLSVFLACIFIGYAAREYFIRNGADEFTINLFFWVGIGLGVLIFVFVILFLDPIVTWTVKQFSKNAKSKLVEKQETDSKNTQILNSVKKIEIPFENIADINSVRKTQQEIKIQQDKEKLQIGLNYTRNKFALYISNQDLDFLCKAIVLYSKKEEMTNRISIETKNLSTLDIYHFGWNIWNHFGGRSHLFQDEISKLLECNFEILNGYTINSIKRHLTDPDTKETIIKLQEDLAEYK